MYRPVSINGFNAMYQVAIISSGIAGTILGTILQKSGLKTLIPEDKEPPAFCQRRIPPL